MNRRSRQQFQAIGNVAYLLLDLEGAEKPEGQVLMRTCSQGTLNIRLQLQENPIANLKCALRSVFARLALHVLLSPQQMLLNEIMHHIPFM
jgi:hypothetical protein